MAGLMVAGAFLTPVVQVIVERVASGDYKDLFNKRLVNKLQITLNSINQVMDDAERKQYQNPNVRIWLDQIKHEVYEVDQLLDEIATSAQRKRKVKHLFLSLTNQFKSRMKDLLDKLGYLLKQNDVLGLKGTCARNELEVSPKSSTRQPTTSQVDESRICGRKGDKEEIINFLLLDNGCSSNHAPIISIVGLGGMGKTTLAQLVYKDQRVQTSFNLKAWVSVSNPFDIIGVTKAILESFDSSSNSENLDILQGQLQQKITGKKCLLVLDDIWNVNWEICEQLFIPFNKESSGIKIIVTTRDKEVALAMKSTKLHALEQLSESDCWSLFARLAFHDKYLSEYPNLESIGKIIVAKCGGLPLAVKTLGNLLRRKFSQNEWVKILETDMWCLSERYSNINPTLRLSYHNLPSNLKRCFAFCSIFPKGYKFDKKNLINLWMANGLLNSYIKNKSKEELGNELFDDLESISFFQRSLGFDGCFVMHDLVNDLAKSESREFCLQVEGDKVQDISERTRHIWSSLNLKDGDRILKHIYKIQGLHSLLVERPRHGGQCFRISKNVQCDLFSKLKYLQMLSFCGFCDNSILYESRKLDLRLADEIGNLKLLRYLNLSWTSIKRLPDSIRKLYNLETLILEGCYKFVEFPLDFYKLDRLRHLNMKGTAIKKMPKKIRRLNHLQTLTNFVVGESSGSDIEELNSLNLLQGKLCLSGLNNVTNPRHAVKSRLQDKKYLEEIHMIFDWEREEMDGSIVESNVSVLDALQPNNNLMRLTIENYSGNMFPKWLSGCDLPNLISLKLQNCKGIKIFCNNSTNVPFKFLEVLEFDCMSEWEEWLCMEGFHRLKELSIINCPKLKRALPQHLPSLQKLVLSRCEMLDVSIPNCDNIKTLRIWKCERILINKLSSSLKHFVIREVQYVEFSIDHLFNCPSLELLVLDFTYFVECPSFDFGSYSPLSELSIIGWQSSSLPFTLHLFPNLKHLHIRDCPELQSFPMGGFPSNLIRLGIFNCPKLIASREDWDFLHLKSLVSISIENCPSLEHLPEECGSLYHLDFSDCPLLKEKYQKEGGEHWHTISHIPSVLIDDIWQQKIERKKFGVCHSGKST